MIFPLIIPLMADIPEIYLACSESKEKGQQSFDQMSPDDQDKYFAYETKLTTLAGRVFIKNLDMLDNEDIINNLPNDIFDILVLIPNILHSPCFMVKIYLSTYDETQFLSVYQRLNKPIKIQVPYMHVDMNNTLFDEIIFLGWVNTLNSFINDGHKPIITRGNIHDVIIKINIFELIQNFPVKLTIYESVVLIKECINLNVPKVLKWLLEKYKYKFNSTIIESQSNCSKEIIEIITPYIDWSSKYAF